ncbi:MAG: alpha/beta hydrolase family protein [Phycisphaerales bacterium JB052]
MGSKRITFDNEDGQQLAGRFDMPQGDPTGYALFAHCFTCSKDTLAASRIARGLTERGIAVLRFDFTGLGESEGEFDATSFGSNVRDLLSACGWLSEHHAPVDLLIGHSLGGAAVVSAAGQMDGVKGVATIGAPSDPTHVRHLFDSHIAEIEREGAAEVSIGGRPFRIGKAFIDDLDAHDPREILHGLRRPLMIFHSPVDQIVGVENAAQMFEWAMHPKSFISLDQADHMLSDRKDADFVASMIAAWSERVLTD